MSISFRQANYSYSFFSVYGKVIQCVVYGGLPKYCYNIESKAELGLYG